jgi:uncharacterized protein YjiS (DUF1127 family)
MTAITERTHAVNALVSLFESLMTIRRHRRYRKRFMNVEHLNDHLLADIGLTRAAQWIPRAPVTKCRSAGDHRRTVGLSDAGNPCKPYLP